MKISIIICGGRHFENYQMLKSTVDKYLENNGILYEEVEIVSGHCQGADMLGERYANEHGCSLRVFSAEWTKYGRAAGPIRNKQMVDYLTTTEKGLVVAFVSDNTRGTRNTIAQAQKLDIETIVTEY